MSKDRQKKNSNNKDHKTKTIVFITAVLNLILTLMNLLKAFIKWLAEGF